MQVLALALALKKMSWPWIEAKAKIFLRLGKSLEHLQIKDLQFCSLQRNYVTCIDQILHFYGTRNSRFLYLLFRPTILSQQSQ